MNNLGLLFQVGLHDNSEDARLQWKAVSLSGTLQRFSATFGSFSLRDAMKYHTLQSMVAATIVMSSKRLSLPYLSMLSDETLNMALCDLESSEREIIRDEYETWHQSVFLHPLYMARHCTFRKKQPTGGDDISIPVLPLQGSSSAKKPQKISVIAPQALQPLNRPVSRSNFIVGVCTCRDQREHYDHLLFEKEQLLLKQNQRRNREHLTTLNHIRQNENLERIMREHKQFQIRSAQKAEHTKRRLSSSQPEPRGPYSTVKAKVRSYRKPKDSLFAQARALDALFSSCI